MSSPLETRIEAVDARALTPIALQAAGCTEGRLVEWTAAPMRPSSGNWGSSIIYRFSGAVETREGAVPWSVVLKVSSSAIAPVGGGEAHVEALERKFAFYASDLVHAFPVGFRSPRCYAHTQSVDPAGHAEYWLWLEDLSTALSGGQWTTDDHYQAACAWGLLGGAFADPGMLARCAWLGGGVCKRYME